MIESEVVFSECFGNEGAVQMIICRHKNVTIDRISHQCLIDVSAVSQSLFNEFSPSYDKLFPLRLNAARQL